MSGPVLAFFTPMIPTQEIVFTTRQGRVIRINFDKHGNRFRPVGTVSQAGTGMSGLNLTDYEGSDPVEVFDRIFDRMKESFDEKADLVVEIDNPCNDEFVKVGHQLTRAAREHMPFVVKLNGETLPAVL